MDDAPAGRGNARLPGSFCESEKRLGRGTPRRGTTSTPVVREGRRHPQHLPAVPARGSTGRHSTSCDCPSRCRPVWRPATTHRGQLPIGNCTHIRKDAAPGLRRALGRHAFMAGRQLPREEVAYYAPGLAWTMRGHPYGRFGGITNSLKPPHWPPTLPLYGVRT